MPALEELEGAYREACGSEAGCEQCGDQARWIQSKSVRATISHRGQYIEALRAEIKRLTDRTIRAEAKLSKIDLMTQRVAAGLPPR